MKDVLDVDCNAALLFLIPLSSFVFNQLANNTGRFAIRDSLRPKDNDEHT